MSIGHVTVSTPSLNVMFVVFLRLSPLGEDKKILPLTLSYLTTLIPGKSVLGKLTVHQVVEG